jgi:hypothetical protein
MSAQNQIHSHHQNPEAGLLQIDGARQPLTKEHQAFNKLTKRIDNLLKKIASETDKMDLLNAYYQSEVFTKVLELGRYKIQLSHLLHKKRSVIDLSKAQNKKLDEVIVDLLDDAFSVIEPDEDIKKVYDHYTEESYDEDMKAEETLMKSMMAEMFKEQFGFTLDPSAFDNNADFKKIENDLKRQMEESQSQQKPRKKTKKQLEKEMVQEQKEELKKKSLRSIYLSLAKLLHPDTEKDESLKAEKEEAMKKVTVAYNDKDIMKLLQIEMQWVSTHKQTLDNTDVDTVAIYVQLLKDQVQQLEFELNMVYNNPRYAHVMEYQHAPLIVGKREIVKMANRYTSTTDRIADHVMALEQSSHPSVAIKACIQEFYVRNDDFPFVQGKW